MRDGALCNLCEYVRIKVRCQTQPEVNGLWAWGSREMIGGNNRGGTILFWLYYINILMLVYKSKL